MSLHIRTLGNYVAQAFSPIIVRPLGDDIVQVGVTIEFY